MDENGRTSMAMGTSTRNVELRWVVAMGIVWALAVVLTVVNGLGASG